MSMLSILEDCYARRPLSTASGPPPADTADAATDPPGLASAEKVLARLRRSTTLLPPEMSPSRGAVHDRFTPDTRRDPLTSERDVLHVLAQAAVRVQTVEATPTISCT